MNNDYIAKPPLFLGRKSGKGFWRQIWRLFRAFARILWQVLIPYNPRPEEPTALPTTAATIDDAQLVQSQWIFDQAEARRDQLERKAQSAFAVIVLLVPLLASIFAFLYHDLHTDVRQTRDIVLLSLSAVLLCLGFVSVVRALLVQSRETLFLGAVIDLKNGAFNTYNKANHARGLLYCSSMNTAMNDYIAQFVKGAQLLTAAAVLILAFAAILIGIEFANHPPSTMAETKIVGPVEITSPQLTALQEDIALLKKDAPTAKDQTEIERRLMLLEAKLADLEAKLDKLLTPKPSHRNKR